MGKNEKGAAGTRYAKHGSDIVRGDGELIGSADRRTPAPRVCLAVRRRGWLQPRL